jgi:hypothetical protein
VSSSVIDTDIGYGYVTGFDFEFVSDKQERGCGGKPNVKSQNPNFKS